jgi:hypothetical protein
MMAKALRKRPKDMRCPHEDWGQLSAEMRALPNDEWRRFTLELVTGAPGWGRYSNAARAAGFGKHSTPTNLAKIAWRMAHDDRVILAVASESRRLLRGGHPEAIHALLNMIRDPKHRSHGQAVLSLLDRTDPIIGRQQIEVSHRIIDPDTEALEELRAMRALGVSREVMIQTFGGNFLPRLERLEAAEMAKRSDDAKVIDAEAIEVASG